MNVDINYLKKLVEILIQEDPYSNVYAGWNISLKYLETRLTRLSEKIRREAVNTGS